MCSNSNCPSTTATWGWLAVLHSVSAAGSQERKRGTGLRCVAAAVLAREDDIDIGGRVLEVLHAQVGVGHLLLHGGGVVLVLLPP